MVGQTAAGNAAAAIVAPSTSGADLPGAIPSSTASFGSTSVPQSRLNAYCGFLAGETDIRISPNFNYKLPIGLVSRKVGPFRAGIDTVVPLWLAVFLRRRSLARILLPDWMQVERLQQVLQYERDPDRASFSPDLPLRHAEISRAVLAACGSDGEIPNVDQIRVLLEDICTVRMDKIRRNVHTISAQSMPQNRSVPIIDVTGIGSLEMQAIRPFVTSMFRDQKALVHKEPTTGNTNVSASEARNQALRSSRRPLRRIQKPQTNNPAPVQEDDADADADDVDDESLEIPTADPSTAPTEGKSRIRRFR
eukprot:scaffold57308_cov55-Attheya_sp.AAC.4